MTRAQLPLAVGLRESATFDNFVAGANGVAVQTLRAGEEPFIYLWGAAGTGRSHLLAAVCRGRQAVMLDLADRSLAPALLEGAELAEVVTLDNVDAVAGQSDWELALFGLFNRIRESAGRLVVAGDGPPSALGIQLPDLVSRFSWGPVFQLHPLSDREKVTALRQRAAGRGLMLSDEAAEYLMRHFQRDTATLFQLLDRLDTASLTEQRRLTIPFIRTILQNG